MNNQKEMKLATSQKGLSIELYQKQSCRAVTLKDTWNSDELSFKKMELESGKPMSKAILIMEISNMVLLLNADMQEIHVDYMADYILQHYYSYSISDITCITDRLVKNNPYGKPILQNLIHELDQYSIEKQEYARTVNISGEKEKLEDEERKIINAKILKTYDAMKKKAKEPVKTQKEKDAEAIAENNRKAEELKKMYG